MVSILALSCPEVYDEAAGKLYLTNPPMSHKELEAVPSALGNGKSLENVLIASPGSALWVNFVLTKLQKVIFLDQPAGLQVSFS